MTSKEPAPEPVGTEPTGVPDGGADEFGDDHVIAEEVAPPVVVVMVTHEPGWWFEETLGSIEAQDYPNISVLIVDASSSEPVALRDCSETRAA